MTLVLTCQPTREGDDLVFPYEVKNAGRVAAWVMDGIAGADPDFAAPSFAALPDGQEAVLGKVLPPLPQDRVMLFSITPLVRRLEPGSSMRSSLAARLPLIEASAYLPDLPVRQHGMAELSSIRLVISAWPATLPGVAALAFEDEVFRLAGADLRRLQYVMEARFPVRRLHMLRRTDCFARDIAAEPAAIRGRAA